MYEVFVSLLEQKGVTPAEVSKATGISKTTFSAWKSGASVPKADKLYALAKYFGVPMEVFFGDEIPRQPVYELSAGQGAYNDTYASEYTDTETPDECSWCRVHGDSMYPILHDGDMVLVHHQSETNAKDLSVVKINGDECTCKYVEITDKGIWLRAENKEVFEDRFYSIQEVLTLPISVIGKVVRMQRSFL